MRTRRAVPDRNRTAHPPNLIDGDCDGEEPDVGVESEGEIEIDEISNGEVDGGDGINETEFKDVTSRGEDDDDGDSEIVVSSAR